MNSWWVTSLLQSGGPALLVTWAFWIIFSVVLHELAHGYTAIRCGDRTPIELGHITLNPVVHMGTSGLIMMAILGVTWGSMPVNPSRMRHWYDEILVTVAGPVTNLGLSLLCVAVLAGTILTAGGQSVMADRAVMFFGTGAMLNMVLAILNMLPLYPLDGGRILVACIPPLRRFYQTQIGALSGFIGLVLIFFYGGDIVFPAANQAVALLVGLVLSMFGQTPTP